MGVEKTRVSVRIWLDYSGVTSTRGLSLGFKVWSPPWKIPVWPAKWVGMGPMLPLFLAALEQTLFLGASGEITDLHSVVKTKYVFQVILGWAAHAMRCPQNGGPLRKQLLPVPGFQ